MWFDATIYAPWLGKFLFPLISTLYNILKIGLIIDVNNL